MHAGISTNTISPASMIRRDGPVGIAGLSPAPEREKREPLVRRRFDPEAKGPLLITKSDVRIKKQPSCPARRWAFSMAAASSSSLMPARREEIALTWPTWTAEQAFLILSNS